MAHCHWLTASDDGLSCFFHDAVENDHG
jgi:hypothetical protein